MKMDMKGKGPAYIVSLFEVGASIQEQPQHHLQMTEGK